MFNDDRVARLAEIQREVERGRVRWAQRLARDYEPVARRLLGAYEAILPRIDNALSGLSDPLNPLYSDDDMRQAQALQSFRDRLARDINLLGGSIVDDAASLQASGARIGVRSGVDMLNAGGMSVQFNQPLVQTVQSAIDYVDSPAFRDAVGRLGAFHADAVSDLIVSGVAAGRNPREIARLAEEYLNIRQSPLNDAYNMIQTTQVYSARRGLQQVYEETGVDRWIWSANIGSPRTCRACVAMHGTVHPTTEILNDHHRGRCAAVPVTPTWRELGFRDGGEVPIQTGVDWFNAQDVTTQREVIGNNLIYSAIQRGELRFDPATIVGTYENDIFGEMRRERSYREIMGG